MGWIRALSGRHKILLQRQQGSQLSLLRSIQALAEAENSKQDEPSVLSAPPEIVELISRRNISIISLSPYITEGIEQALQASTRNAKAIRKSGFALTERLKENSRSRHRGGLNELTTVGGTARLKVLNKKVPTWSITAQNIRIQGLMDATDDAAEAFEQSYDLPRDEEATHSSKVQYTASETVGYAASRLPACYAVVWRVLDEVNMRVADFKPESMLDFGAGPGTAIWAASEVVLCKLIQKHEVWEESLSTVHAVEPSEAMRWMGIQIEQRAKSPCDEEMAEEAEASGSHSQANPVSDLGNEAIPIPLEAQQSSAESGAATAESASERRGEASTSHFPEEFSGKNYHRNQGDDLSGGRTVIGERLSNPNSSFGRSWCIRWLDHLHGFGDRKQIGRERHKGRQPRRSSWVQSTGGRRYDLVLASYSFGELSGPREQRQALKAMWQATDDMLVIIEPGTPAGSGLVRAARAQILEWETEADGSMNAHVVAPCPHDGRCPMDGIQAWCHFSQKFERPRTQRLAKIRHGKPLPRSFQDERFSYVVLRRGPRPQPGMEVVSTEQLELVKKREHPARREEARQGGVRAMHADKAVQELIRQSLQGDGDSEEDEDLEWELEAEVSEMEEDMYDGGFSEQETLASDQDNLAAPVLSGREETDGEGEAELIAAEESIQHAVTASHGWSRIVRRPRKRKGHIIVDLCSAAGPPQSPNMSGVLLQQAVAKSERKKWIGTSGYKMIKKMAWGDLWPSSFQKYAHSVKERAEHLS